MPEPAGLLLELLKRRVVILTGKGGVGKSTSSAAIALIAAQQGKKVLVIEVDAKGNVPDFFDTTRVGFKYRRLHENVYGLSMQPRESMHEYLSIMLHVPRFSLNPLNGFMQYASQAIPGLKEILVTGKIYYEEKQFDGDRRRWDLVVVDGAPTGHVVSQLGAAGHLKTLVKSGPIHDQAQMIDALLTDQERTAVLLVTTPEEMPTLETIDLAGRFADETGIDPLGLIINQLQPRQLSGEVGEEFRDLLTRTGAQKFQASHPEGEPLLLAGEILLEERRRADHLRAMLRRT
ncbi:MAG TPA: ArsA-related P-loop ATPase, partial [Candidatus Dormibacteraeota bacterium]|nr:ArsA-related P-loop ATPase [Candidatus Dormibacteraeota bacterium]